MKKRKKINTVLPLAIELLQKGHFVISEHALLRQQERQLSLGDIRNILFTGYHEKKKDEYNDQYKDWNYAVCGQTLDREKARICLAFDHTKLLIIITVIRLEKSQ